MGVDRATKFGPLVTPGGLLGDSAVQAINVAGGVVQVIGPLPANEKFSVTGDVAMFAMLGSAGAVGVPGAPVISAANLALGVDVPAGIEAYFDTDDSQDLYLAWISQDASAGTKFRCNIRSKGKR